MREVVVWHARSARKDLVCTGNVERDSKDLAKEVEPLRSVVNISVEPTEKPIFRWALPNGY